MSAALVMDLYAIPPKSLDKFIDVYLNPASSFTEDMGKVINTICEFLKENCFKNSGKTIKVQKVVKGGSAGKGTTLKNDSDVDLVVFLDCFKSYRDQQVDRQDIVTEIREQLNQFSQMRQHIKVRFDESRKRSLGFKLQIKEETEWIKCDVLPAFNAIQDVTGEKPKPQVYIDLINLQAGQGEFSTCFTELQRDFIKALPAKVKNLLRLVKYWYKKHVKKHSKYPGHLPTKYALELLTVHIWRQGSSKEDFKMEEGFRTLLEIIQQYQHLCIYWTKYYDQSSDIITEYLTRQLKAKRPIILDPADPTNNVAKNDGWDTLAQEAKRCLTQMNSRDLVKFWTLQPCTHICMTVRSIDGKQFTFHENPAVTIKNVKEKIKAMWNIPVNEQRLTIHPGSSGTTAVLTDSKQLLDYKILEDVIFCVLRTEAQPISIIVRCHDDRRIPFKVKLNDNVQQLKQKIYEHSHIPMSQQRLIYRECEMEDQKTMEYYQITEGSVIMLLLRLRGG